MDKLWRVYLLHCRDDTYYTGISTDVYKRLAAHNNGKGAKYTRARLPVIWLVSSREMTHREALQAERRIKKLKRCRKTAAIRRL